MTEPIYQEDGITLYCGDCRDILPQFPDKSFDLVLTDPPYGIDYLSNRTDNHNKIINDGFDLWQTKLPEWLQELKRVINDSGCCCCCCGGGGKTPVTAIFTLEFIKHFNLIQTLVWDKLTIGLGWRYRPSYETIIIGSKDKDNYNFYDESKTVSNVLKFNNVIPQKGEHPTVKPVPLMKRLIQIHSLSDHIILDPFCGSGTTLVAAKQLGRKAVGIEISEKYCQLTTDRLRQKELFL